MMSFISSATASKGQNRELILNTLKKKCEYKGIAVPTFDSLKNSPERRELESEWEHMLGYQVPVLPPFSQYWEALPAVFEWLLQAAEVAAPAAIPNLGHEVDTTWHPPAMAQAWRARAPIEIIRYAASTRLCVNLTYDGTDRLIEPYSLRRTRDGNLLLYAVKHTTGENRSYRVDRIQDAKATNISFQPKYAIELAETSRFDIPLTASRSLQIESGLSHRILPKIRPPRVAKLVSGPKYVFQCGFCGKKFAHRSNDSHLGKHKNKQGYPCPGQSGNFVRMRF